MKTAINFGGFYNSWHEEQVEYGVAYAGDFADESGNIQWDEVHDSINSWEPYFEQYAQAWLDQFNDEVGTSLTLEGINSPREYNFRTDAIMASLTIQDFRRIFAYIREHDLKDQAIEIMRDITTSRSGYIAFYSYPDLFKRENRDLLAQCLIDAIIEENGGSNWIVEEFYPDYSPELGVAA